jgi:hypothetical protein
MAYPFLDFLVSLLSGGDVPFSQFLRLLVNGV